LNTDKNVNGSDGRNDKKSRIIPSGCFRVKRNLILTIPIIIGILSVFIRGIASNDVKKSEFIITTIAATETATATSLSEYPVLGGEDADEDGFRIDTKENVILLTGFEPFGGYTVNSSWEAVKSLDGMQVLKDVRIISIKIPVLWESAGEILEQNIDRYDPIIVINVGQGSDQIALERIARNRAGPLPDNANKFPLTDTIMDGGPIFYETRFDLESLQQQLGKAGIVSIISDNAGDYLCNYLSYYSNNYLSKKYVGTPTMFVHVPPISDLNNPSDAENLRQIIAALKILVIQDYYQYSNWSK